MLRSLRQLKGSEAAKLRLKILQFYDQFGPAATFEAFEVDRKLIHVWRKRLKAADGNITSLIPLSTKPTRSRHMNTDPRIVTFIGDLRQEHPRLGKEKIKTFLDQYCQSIGIQPIAISTIGKIIKRNNMFFQKKHKHYHDPDGAWASNTVKKKPKLRAKRSVTHPDFGHFQADSTHVLFEGARRYLVTAIDTALKFAFVACYSQLSSRSALDFFKRLQSVYPLPIKSVQTDNGSEFLGEFESYINKIGIAHLFSYPRCPKINGCVERFNRTLKEEFVYNHLDSVHDLTLFRLKLAEYLVFYNGHRPHKTLGLKSPLQFLAAKGDLSNMCVTHTKY
jgi:IS30 family transposase